MKKMNNKGFSLVELIVVVAIMAVLIGVLAPQYLRYVEKSRLQKDNAAVGELANAIKIACAEEEIYNEVAGATATFTVSTTELVFSSTGSTGLEKELSKVIGKIKLSSNTYGTTGLTVTATVVGNDTIEVKAANWVSAVGASKAEKVF